MFSSICQWKGLRHITHINDCNEAPWAPERYRRPISVGMETIAFSKHVDAGIPDVEDVLVSLTERSLHEKGTISIVK